MMRAWLRKTAIVVAGLAVTAGVALYLLQNHIIYLPVVPGMSQSPRENPKGYRNPGERGMKYEDVTLKTEDKETLRGWGMYQTNRKAVPTIIFFHENAGNLGYRLDFFQELYNSLGVNIIAIAYRGYSDSTGHPSEPGLQSDAAAIMKFAFTEADIDTSKIILFGRSLGGAVAVYSLWKFPQYMVKGHVGRGIDSGKHV